MLLYWFLWRTTKATSSILVSLVLGAVAFAVSILNYPEFVSMLFGWARNLKIALTSTGLVVVKYNVFLELLLEERQLVFMFFVVAVRLAMAVAGGLMLSLARAVGLPGTHARVAS